MESSAERDQHQLTNATIDAGEPPYGNVDSFLRFITVLIMLFIVEITVFFYIGIYDYEMT
jgi:hypothetical protein